MTLPHLFIYGSLMRGESNHAFLRQTPDAARWLQDARTEPQYSLHWTTLGEYPGLLDGGHTAVWGEIYAVSAARRAQLDAFEDHPSLYERRPLALQGLAGVEAYFLVNPAHAAARIATGSWRQRALKV